MDTALTWLGTEKDISLEMVSYNTATITFYKKFGFIAK